MDAVVSSVGAQQARIGRNIQSTSALGAGVRRSQTGMALCATHVAKSVVSTDLELRQHGHVTRAAKSVTTQSQPEAHLSFVQESVRPLVNAKTLSCWSTHIGDEPVSNQVFRQHQGASCCIDGSASNGRASTALARASRSTMSFLSRVAAPTLKATSFLAAAHAMAARVRSY